jgi:translocation and assembly module TamB
VNSSRGLRRLATLALGLVLVVVLVAMLGAAGLYWASSTPAGTAWLLGQLQRVGVQVDGPQGSLQGDFQATKIQIHVGRTGITIDAPHWQGLRLGYARYRGGWLVVRAARVWAQQVTVQVRPDTNPKRPALPPSLRLPIEIDIDEASVGQLHMPGLPSDAFWQVRSRVHLGAEQGTQHRFDALQGVFGPMALGGHARIAATGSMELDVQIDASAVQDACATEIPPLSPAVEGGKNSSVLRAPVCVKGAQGEGKRRAHPSESHPAGALSKLPQTLGTGWQGQVIFQGPLAGFEANATLTAQAQSLQANAHVTPFAVWALPKLQASTKDFDLAELLPRAPATALSGSVSIVAIDPEKGAAGGLQWNANLTNAQAGAWDAQQLPIRSVKWTMRTPPNFAAPVTVPQFELVLAQAGGTLQGSALWDGRQLTLKADLAQIRPHVVHSKLPRMVLSGPVTMSSNCTKSTLAPLPWSQWLCSAQPHTAPTFKAHAEIDGNLLDLQRAVSLKFKASGTPQHIELQELLASTGGASATLTGSADHQTGGVWQVQSKADLVNFDPRTWLPNTLGEAPYLLNLQAQSSLNISTRSPHDLLKKIQGQAEIQWQRSLLAGVPVAGKIHLQRTALSDPLLAKAQLELGSNTLNLEGSLQDGPKDSWSVQAKAPALAQLGQVIKTFPGLQRWATLQGALNLDAQLVGRWPALSVQAKAHSAEIKLGEISLGTGEAALQWTPLSSAPLLVQLTLSDAAWGVQRLGATELKISGTPQDHAVSLGGIIKASPPLWMQNLQSRSSTSLSQSMARTYVAATAKGRLSGGVFDANSTPLAWQGVLAEFALGSAQNSAQNNAQDKLKPWVSARNVDIKFTQGASPKLSVGPGRADIFTAGVHWDRIEWQPAKAGTPQLLSVLAELEPLAVAPVLQRLQPGFGWDGDLKIQGKVDIQHHSQNFAANAVLERLSGDLVVTDEAGTQALGLTDLVLNLSAQDGTWNFSQGMAGKQLGAAAGAVVVRTSKHQSWPHPGDPMQGVLQAQVDQLGTWGAWVPAGWRLGGKVSTTASVAGTFGAPQYTGQIQGQGITVRNLLEGVNIQNGTIDIALQGDTARIHSVSAQAGSGTVHLSGNATLGKTPRTELQLTAQKFQLLSRIDRRIIASGHGRVLLEKDQLHIDSQLKIDEGLFDFTQSDAPTLGDDVVVSNRTNRSEPEQPSSTSPPAPTQRQRNTHLNLQFDLGEQLKVRGKGIDTGLQGQLKVTTPAGKPSWNGSVRAVDGTYAAYGQKLNIERGIITFNGPVADPRLDIHAARPNLDVEVGVAISGTAQNPRVRLYSEPEMSELNKLSWLILGRANEGLGTADTALLQRAALGLLAGDSPSITDKVLHSVGIDELSVRQSEGEVRDTVVSLGKQLSRRWYLGYERGLNTTTGTWQLIYRIAQRFTLRGQQGRENSLDMIWSWRWE